MPSFLRTTRSRTCTVASSNSAKPAQLCVSCLLSPACLKEIFTGNSCLGVQISSLLPCMLEQLTATSNWSLPSLLFYISKRFTKDFWTLVNLPSWCWALFVVLNLGRAGFVTKLLKPFCQRLGLMCLFFSYAIDFSCRNSTCIFPSLRETKSKTQLCSALLFPPWRSLTRVVLGKKQNNNNKNNNKKTKQPRKWQRTCITKIMY